MKSKFNYVVAFAVYAWCMCVLSVVIIVAVTKGLPDPSWYEQVDAQLAAQSELLLKQSIIRVDCPHEVAQPATPATPSAEIDYQNLLINEPPKYNAYEVALVAQTVWGEGRACSKEEWMLIVWCICNRADAYDMSIEEVVLAKNQFHGYNPSNPIDKEIVATVVEVLDAWESGEEALIHEPYATTSDYLFFYGDGKHNWFREEWK